MTKGKNGVAYLDAVVQDEAGWRQPKAMMLSTITLGDGWVDAQGDPLTTQVVDDAPMFPATDAPRLSEPGSIIRCLLEARTSASRMETRATFGEIAAVTKRRGFTGGSAPALRGKYHVGDVPFMATDTQDTDWSITVEVRPGKGGETRWFVATRPSPTPSN